MNRKKVRFFPRGWVWLVFSMSLILLFPNEIHAAGVATVVEQKITADTVYLYINGVEEAQTAEVRIGTEAIDDVSILPGDQMPIVTWLLLDNSGSIGEEERSKATDLFTDLVAGKASNEKFVLATYGEQLNILSQDADSYVDLKAQIDGIQYAEQKSYLTDVLEDILNRESDREEQAFVRIILVSDGTDENPAGLTREELDIHLAAANIPIYTFGCEREDNAYLLKELYALSRQTGADSWSLTGMEKSLEAAEMLHGEEIPLCAEIPIPEKLRDGSTKGIQLAFGDDTVAQTQATMPFGGDTPDGSGAAPDVQPSEHGSGGTGSSIRWIIVAAIIGAVFFVLIIAVIVVLVKRRREKNQIRSVATIEESERPVTELVDPTPTDGGTVILVHHDSQLKLILSDLTNPEHRFEVPLCGHVTIGRSAQNMVVIDYDRAVSSFQCEIYMEGSSIKLKDVGSRNGTYIDGVRIVDLAEISNGSTIRMGKLNFLVEIR